MVSSGRVHARNLIANWTGHGANLVVMFFLSPFILHTLGSVEYGIWSLLGILTGYAGLLDLGVRVSTGRYIVLYFGKGDDVRLDETIRTALGFFSIIGLLILLAGVALGLGFPIFFATAPAEYHRLVAILLPILAVNIWLTSASAVFYGVLTAYDRFDLARSVDLTVLAVRTVGVVLTLKAGYGIVGLTIATVGSNLLGILGNGYLARRVRPRIRIWPLMLSRERIRELFGYGVAAFISNIAFMVVGQTGLVIVGALVSVSAVTTYSVGAMLVLYSMTFVRYINLTFFPPLQRAVAREDAPATRWYFLRQTRMAIVFAVPIFVGYIVFGRTFITLWMGGPQFPETAIAGAALVMAVLSVSKLTYLFSDGAGNLLAATGHIRFNAILAILETVASLGLSVAFVLIFGWGLVGVAAGALAAGLLVPCFIAPWYACGIAGVKGTRLLRMAFTGLVAAVAFGVWCCVIRRLIPADSWVLFAVQVASALVGYVPIALGLLISADDRRRVLRALRLVPSSGG